MYDEIAFELGISRYTVSDWADIVRNVIAEHLLKISQKIGGVDQYGVSKIVEIDESLFFKRKYNRGIIKHGTWYVGGVERGTKNIFIVPWLTEMPIL